MSACGTARSRESSGLVERFVVTLPTERAALMAATQRPVAELAFSEPPETPAWKNLPSLTVVATDDKAAGSGVIRSMAQRDKATITEAEGSHVSMISQPPAVTDVIVSAAAAVTVAVNLAQARRLYERERTATPMSEDINMDPRSFTLPATTGALPSEGRLPSFDGAITWLNSPPLTMADLRGHVVLVDFWTYTCINWLRTLAYVRAWAEEYKDQGVVVIGVHTPEFTFEHDVENVRRAAMDLRVPYPIAVDSNYAIWNAFSNHYWPALYVVDATGHIRHHNYGEGDYEQTDRVIQQVLAEAGSGSGRHDPVSVVASAARGFEVAADWNSLASPETYLGYERTENFASPGGAELGTPRNYTVPVRLRHNEWALSGDWTMELEPAVLNTAPGRIAYRFHARDVNLVMGPVTRGTPVRFRVLLDGAPPGVAHGLDVDDQGHGTVSYPRLHQLIRQPGPIADRQVEIEFLDAGAAAYCFTFG